MKIRTLIAGTITLVLLAISSVQAADQMTSLHAKSGSKMRIEGTSTLHDWQVESRVIGGSIEVGPNFPVEPGQDVKLGKVDAQATASIPVRSCPRQNDCPARAISGGACRWRVFRMTYVRLSRHSVLLPTSLRKPLLYRSELRGHATIR